jgi:uncharacterized protein (DUF433 family)
MTLSVSTELVPIVIDNDGVAHIGKTRVTLETVIEAFLRGATAEEIAHQYPSLRLADVYAVIAYYLHRRSEVDAYLHERKRVAERSRRHNEERFDPSGVRDRLLARQRKDK